MARLIVAVGLIVIIVVACSFVLKVAGFSTKKTSKSKANDKSSSKREQDALVGYTLPVAGIIEGAIERTDGSVITGIKVCPKNVSLNAQEEDEAVARAEGQLFASIGQPFSIVTIRRTPDNSLQRQHLNEELALIDKELATLVACGAANKRIKYLTFRRQVLCEILKDACSADKYAAPTQVETYLLLRSDPKRTMATPHIAKENTETVLKHLGNAGFDAHQLDDKEMLWLLKSYFDEIPADGCVINPAVLWPEVRYASEEK